MLKIFISGLGANIIFVCAGLVKQYLLAAQMSVANFGAYGTAISLASLSLLIIPFPAYLDIMVRGFSDFSKNSYLRHQLIAAVRKEILILTILVGAGFSLILGATFICTFPDQLILSISLLLLSQYIGAALDLMLRMQQAHRTLAFFMVLRNLPAIFLLMLTRVGSPLLVAGIDLIASVFMLFVFLNSNVLRVRAFEIRSRFRFFLTSAERTLWFARLFQFVNSSLLRLVIPFVCGAHETGLFFFSMIAQLPCSLFLSVTTQMYGHTLASLKRGEWKSLWIIQAWFILPNLAYVIVAALFMPFWEGIAIMIPGLAKYKDAGSLIMAVIVYSSVLASDCQEYLLRTRGLAHVLLQYSLFSVCVQALVVAGVFGNLFDLIHAIYFAAFIQVVVLILFTYKTFKLTIGIKL
ncbi:hypothetical protein [Undibacterium crateris]|uniref:hypothetical protein n=1 Tax=Undibacterium crateris TaxID=2528175 RepID=UPI00138A3D67|nr:hypothetical protein [Undibacterium crateris]NDI84628.1 hypothetical protein [Undibacterium crateris]